jgi:cytochrome c oxidase subunit 2
VALRPLGTPAARAKNPFRKGFVTVVRSRRLLGGFSRLAIVRRGVLVRLVAVGLAAAAVASAVAYFVPWLPTPASKQADRIDFVFWFVTGISIAIFALVVAVILYSVARFRAGPDDDSDGAPIHGNTTLEIAWTAVPAVLVTAVAVVSAVALAQNEHLPKNHLQVNVLAQQFAWSFSYPKYKGLTVSALHLPLDETVELKMHSKDVIHSFWVPQFGQKQDLVPGITTRVVITPKRLGTYPVVCTELCGEGHALMRSEAIVMKPTAFAAWVKAQERAAASASQGPSGAGPGLAVFNSNGCSGCHTFKPAGSSATTGPDLDNLPAYARRAGKPLALFVRESIVDPNAYIEKGYQPNIMPSTFKSLPKQQLDALVQFLTGGKK